jgi:hypothetical protein
VGAQLAAGDGGRIAFFTNARDFSYYLKRKVREVWPGIIG